MLLFRKWDFLIFKVSNSNMPQFFFRKKPFLFVVQMSWKKWYLTNTWCVCQVAGISKRSNDKQTSFFFLKKIGVLLFETVKNLIFWIVTRVSARDYTFGLSSPAVFPQIFLIWFYKALISIGGTTSLGAFCHFIRKLCAPSIINNLYLSRIIISIKDSFHFNNIWFRTLLEKSVKYCKLK